jgi:hypothetical protein
MNMAKQYEMLNCPFCNENTISCIYFPPVTQIKTSSTATFGKTKQRTRSSETWIIQSGCSKCSKTQEDVEKKLRDDDII